MDHRKGRRRERFAFRLESRTAPKKIEIYNTFVKQSGRFKPGVRYRISYFVRLDNVVAGTGDGGVGIRIWCDHNSWFPQNRMTGSTGWIHQEFFFTAGKNCGNFESQLSLYLWHSTGAVEFADLRIEEAD